MVKFVALLALCDGSPVDSQDKWLVMRSCYSFHVVSLSMSLIKQSSGGEMRRPCACDVTAMTRTCQRQYDSSNMSTVLICFDFCASLWQKHRGISNQRQFDCLFDRLCMHEGNIKAMHHWSFVRGSYWWLLDFHQEGPAKHKVFQCHEIIMGTTKLLGEYWFHSVRPSVRPSVPHPVPVL